MEDIEFHRFKLLIFAEILRKMKFKSFFWNFENYQENR